MPLTMLAIGEKGKIRELTGDLGMRRYLAQLGFSLGKGIEIVQQSFGNSLIIKLDNSRLALDRRMALHIHIDMFKTGEGS
ncbi:MAG: ferrous iron transport protein A [Candidatus Omnitrophica bacterium]|nr:ferrous iron transport protein A [Candidatus Omnitrophota bacterium]